MFRIGAHVSSAGNVANAVDREHDLGGTCGQIFIGSPRGWKAGSVNADDRDAFRTKSAEHDIGPWIVHGTYLINLATPKDGLAKKSVDAVQAELDAAATLGIPYYTFHPGAHTGAGRETGLQNVADRISQLDIPDETMLLLENTAGKGTTVGKSFADLHAMIEQSDYGFDRVGVCLDTCHLYAAGHDFTTEAKLADMLEVVEDELGIKNVHYLHINDSKHPLGSEKDEHADIGHGEIGDVGFKVLVNHRKLRDKPMVVEVPCEDGRDFTWNIEHVRSLLNHQD